ncbi:hypothetical protein IW261DRAFT_1418430 [Armillaria novae-zelandiae]|uniref:Uncharacterized protein n=1 Tax=Armillaria novae-zelandiae TaxID=153914 RepID=A0AA39PDG4_9AGAR|nr:hypothetical protein IW261DRAFT_1418430 [Armillaria novae-zelandiae]
MQNNTVHQGPMNLLVGGNYNKCLVTGGMATVTEAEVVTSGGTIEIAMVHRGEPHLSNILTVCKHGTEIRWGEHYVQPSAWDVRKLDPVCCLANWAQSSSNTLAR